MIRTLFGEIQTGRLARLAFLGYWLLVSALVVVVALGIGASIGLAERAIGGELVDAQALLQEKLGLVGLIAIIAIYGGLLFAHLNIAAKRIRDIGLPPWWSLLGILVIGLVGYIIGGEQLASGISLLIFLSFFILPSEAFGPRTPA